jgi:hypothetical protein
MDALLRDIYVNLPQADVNFFEKLAGKMGWTIKTKESILQRFIDTRPKNVDLSDEEIMAEVYSVRYAK